MTLADIDAATLAADERMEARLKARGLPSPLDADPVFIVEDPPPKKGERKGVKERKELIAFLTEHPYRWVRYAASGNGDAIPSRIAALVHSGHGGFGPYFETTIRGSKTSPVIYVRYCPPPSPEAS